MRLRGRFTLWFALAALVPIVVAAVVTRHVVARSYRQEHERTRAAAEQALRREVERLRAELEVKVGPDVLGSKDHDLARRFFQVWRSGGREAEVQRELREGGHRIMRTLLLDFLMITDERGQVLAALHWPALMGDEDGRPQRWAARQGEAFFARVKVQRGGARAEILVVAAARRVSDAGRYVHVAAGREVTAAVLDAVRRPGRVDARVVDADGGVVLAAVEPDFDKVYAAWPIRIALDGADSESVAWLELAVSSEGLDQLLLQVTLVSAALAASAVLLMVLLGLVVARRMTRDLDRLVEGAQAAARGDLGHRVQVASKDEVGAVAAELNRMMEDLHDAKERLVIAERIAAWQEIARRLAHEIKNPLTPIQMAMDTLRKTWRKQHPQMGEILEESTATVLEEADRLKRIVAEFSEFARLPKPTFGPCELGEVVTSTLALYQGGAPVQAKLADGLPAIEADRGQLHQVLLNLLENARDAIAQRHGAGGGAIVVSTRRGDAGDRVELIVDDDGPGVPAEIKDRLFTPYFTTKQGKGGTGLGLAIVHRVVSDHGGRITVADAPGGGARFVVELPIKQGAPLLASRV